MINKQKGEKNATSIIFFTIFLQQMLNSRLLQPIIDGKKKKKKNYSGVFK